MRSIDPFRPSPDEELGRLLREEMTGPDPQGFLDRLSHHLARLPAQPSQWDVLAHWARPRVMAAAVAAAFLLGVALYSNWATHDLEQQTTAAGIPAAAIMAPLGDVGPITYAILEGR